MNALDDEATFFKFIAPKIRALVAGYNGKASISVQKTSMDYATEIDIAVENLIVAEINLRFPEDLVLAEEGHNDTPIPHGRIWIVDPICGTGNIGRGLTTFCTNIALADNGVLIASCVVDYSQNDYFWSVGNNTIFINDKKVNVNQKVAGMGNVIDVDMGAATCVSGDDLQKYIQCVERLVPLSDYMLMSLNSSLGFAYTAIGKIDGFINVYNHPWDICASAFLIQQIGGTITDLKGNPWHIESTGAIGTLDKELHSQLVAIYNS